VADASDKLVSLSVKARWHSCCRLTRHGYGTRIGDRDAAVTVGTGISSPDSRGWQRGVWMRPHRLAPVAT
jgi:hypothetical protein